MANGKMPKEIIPMIRDCEMHAGPKKDSDDVRPIGIGSIFKKIIGIRPKNKLAEFNIEHFGDIQFALQPGGCEKIISSFAMAMETQPEKHKIALDGKNAFNSCNRQLGLKEIYFHKKELMHYCLDHYGSDPKLWYYMAWLTESDQLNFRKDFCKAMLW